MNLFQKELMLSLNDAEINGLSLLIWKIKGFIMEIKKKL